MNESQQKELQNKKKNQAQQALLNKQNQAQQALQNKKNQAQKMLLEQQNKATQALEEQKQKGIAFILDKIKLIKTTVENTKPGLILSADALLKILVSPVSPIAPAIRFLGGIGGLAEQLIHLISTMTLLPMYYFEYKQCLIDTLHIYNRGKNNAPNDENEYEKYVLSKKYYRRMIGIMDPLDMSEPQLEATINKLKEQLEKLKDDDEEKEATKIIEEEEKTNQNKQEGGYQNKQIGGSENSGGYEANYDLEVEENINEIFQILYPDLFKLYEDENCSENSKRKIESMMEYWKLVNKKELCFSVFNLTLDKSDADKGNIEQPEPDIKTAYGTYAKPLAVVIANENDLKHNIAKYIVADGGNIVINIEFDDPEELIPIDHYIIRIAEQLDGLDPNLATAIKIEVDKPEERKHINPLCTTSSSSTTAQSLQGGGNSKYTYKHTLQCKKANELKKNVGTTSSNLTPVNNVDYQCDTFYFCFTLSSVSTSNIESLITKPVFLKFQMKKKILPNNFPDITWIGGDDVDIKAVEYKDTLNTGKRENFDYNHYEYLSKIARTSMIYELQLLKDLKEKEASDQEEIKYASKVLEKHKDKDKAANTQAGGNAENDTNNDEEDGENITKFINDIEEKTKQLLKTFWYNIAFNIGNFARSLKCEGYKSYDELKDTCEDFESFEIDKIKPNPKLINDILLGSFEFCGCLYRFTPFRSEGNNDFITLISSLDNLIMEGESNGDESGQAGGGEKYSGALKDVIDFFLSPTEVEAKEGDKSGPKKGLLVLGQEAALEDNSELIIAIAKTYYQNKDLKWGEKDRMIKIKKNGEIEQINLDNKEAVKEMITDINIIKDDTEKNSKEPVSPYYRTLQQIKNSDKKNPANEDTSNHMITMSITDLNSKMEQLEAKFKDIETSRQATKRYESAIANAFKIKKFFEKIFPLGLTVGLGFKAIESCDWETGTDTCVPEKFIVTNDAASIASNTVQRWWRRWWGRKTQRGGRINNKKVSKKINKKKNIKKVKKIKKNNRQTNKKKQQLRKSKRIHYKK